MEREKAINILKKAVSLEKGKEIALAREFNTIEDNIKNIDNKVDAFSVSVENKFEALTEEVKKKSELVLDFSKEDLVEEVTETVEEILTPKIEAIEQAVSQETKDKAKELLGVVSDKHNSALLEVRQLNNKFIKNHEQKIDEINLLIEEVKSIETQNGIDGKDGSPDTAEQVRDKLSSLEGDERLDVSAIKGLDYVKPNDLRNAINSIPRAGGGSGGIEVFNSTGKVGSGSGLKFIGTGISSVASDGHTTTVTVEGGSNLINISNPDPAGQEGLMTINSSSNILKVYYGGIWHDLHTLLVTSSYYLTEDGFYYLTEGGDRYLIE